MKASSSSDQLMPLSDAKQDTAADAEIIVVKMIILATCLIMATYLLFRFLSPAEFITPRLSPALRTLARLSLFAGFCSESGCFPTYQASLPSTSGISA